MSLNIQQHYLIFAYLRKLADQEAVRHADMAIDLDLISQDPSAATRAELSVLEATGCTVSFGDCKVTRYDELVAREAPFYDGLDTLIDQELSRSGTFAAA